jgi:hypothetical protein
MENTLLEFQPTSVAEWDEEDEMVGVLAGEMLVKADDAEARTMLNAVILNLPRQIDQVELIAYAAQRPTPLGLDLPPDSGRSDFYLVEMPLNILVPGPRRLVKLRLSLDLQLVGAAGGDAVAYDLYPKDTTDVKTILTGDASLDVSKALKFALGVIPAGAAAAPLADCLGLKLDLPFKWSAKYAQVQTTDRLSNPVEWYVTDGDIQNGFTADVIIRAPRGASVQVSATVTFELRWPGPLGNVLKAQYVNKASLFPLQG